MSSTLRDMGTCSSARSDLHSQSIIPPNDFDFLKKAGCFDVFGPGTKIQKAAVAVIQALDMQRRLMYIEQGTGYNHNGPAWIGYVQFSRTGRAAYFNGQCFQRTVGPDGDGNHFDLETGDTYWITGVKKRGSNRHVFGTGKVLVSRDALAEFLSTKGWKELDETHYGLFDAQPTDTARSTAFQNTKLGS